MRAHLFLRRQGFLFPERQRDCKDGVRADDMDRFLTNMHLRFERQPKVIALCEAATRALGVEETV
jgi:hypothetical protein